MLWRPVDAERTGSDSGTALSRLAMKPTSKLPEDTDLQTTLRVLETLVEDRGLLAELNPTFRAELLVAAGKVSRPDKASKKKLAKAHRRLDKIARREEEETVLEQTGIRKLRDNPIFLTPRRIAQYAAKKGLPAPGEATPVPTDDAALATIVEPADAGPTEPIGTTNEPRTCYVCREKTTDIHWFYDQMCVPCGDFNHSKRAPVGDLKGRYALVTGSRLKIGYQAAIMLLRSGCHVVCTTRFPRDAAKRYAAEEDFQDWGHRLDIHGIDLRHVPSVEAFCDTLLATLPRLDLIINNACQTVRRPPGFYKHLMDLERSLEGAQSPRELELLADPTAAAIDANANPTRALTSPAVLTSAEMSQVPQDGDVVAIEDGREFFPAGQLDADLQQVDLRPVNSWRLKLAEVPTVELLEVHIVNAVAPFLINGRLKPLMARVPSDDAHIINVSAMEGQFYRSYKSDRHPHTNMAKASLNMMTRTSAADYVEFGIHMNSVDTGWVTDEDPAPHAEAKRAMHRFHPPLDIVDGAARIVAPFFDGINTGEHVWGQFIKDYKIADW